MKALKIVILIALLPCRLFAGNTDSAAKAYFHIAKTQLENMLNGKEAPSYEKAIFLIENAWWEGGIDYNSYRDVLTLQTDRIKRLACNYLDKSKSFVSDLSGTKEQKEERYLSALTNFAIYQYMTSLSLWDKKDGFACHKPYTYSKNDPMGTTYWTNTQVTHLINEGSGNCFALASLFRILSERLKSDAILCTAPSHIYIRHADEKGTYYNVELSSRAFPGTGTIETLTYTPDEATRNNIALRELTTKQSIALCLVYLAKGYEYKFGTKEKEDEFMLACAETTLKYDDHNLNAMLLKAEILENRLVRQNKDIAQLQNQQEFKNYQQWITHIFKLGYREMPFEMKNILIKGWTKDTVVRLAGTDHTPKNTNSKIRPVRYASLSWGLFDEQIKTKPFERFGNTVFDTKKQQIVAFLDSDTLYNHYDFDPVVFAWNIDPLAHKFPHQSPYSAFGNNPILNIDLDGLEGVDYTKNSVLYSNGKPRFQTSDANNTAKIPLYTFMINGSIHILHRTKHISFNPSSAPTALGLAFNPGYYYSLNIKHYSSDLVGFTDNQLPGMITKSTGIADNLARGGFANTFRHFAWQSMIAMALGDNIAKRVGDYHEADGIKNTQNGEFRKDNVIDLMNNEYARDYAKGFRFDVVTKDAKSFAGYLNGLVQYITSTVDGYIEDSKFDDIRNGKVKLFDASDKNFQKLYKSAKYLDKINVK